MKRLIWYWLVVLVGLSCQSPEKTTTTGIVEGKKIEDVIVQNNRFEEEIRNFEIQDSINGVMESCVLFTGSSSIRMWTDLEKDMEGLSVLNRGFGGSTIPEVQQYADRFLFKHKPKVLVFYCGENDIHEGATAEQVYLRFRNFFNEVNSKLPELKWVYISMKPSVARWTEWSEFQKGNDYIQAFLKGNQQAKFMDCSHFMMDKNGVVRSDLFIEDGLHMNKLGYILWTKQLKPRIESFLN